MFMVMGVRHVQGDGRGCRGVSRVQGDVRGVIHVKGDGRGEGRQPCSSR